MNISDKQMREVRKIIPVTPDLMEAFTKATKYLGDGGEREFDVLEQLTLRIIYLAGESAMEVMGGPVKVPIPDDRSNN